MTKIMITLAEGIKLMKSDEVLISAYDYAMTWSTQFISRALSIEIFVRQYEWLAQNNMDTIFLIILVR